MAQEHAFHANPQEFAALKQAATISFQASYAVRLAKATAAANVQ